MLILGMAIGVATGFAVRPDATGLAPPPPQGPMPASPPPRGSSAELAAKLLQRVGSHLIADDRAASSGDGSISFYAVPKPYGDSLCRVDVYTVAPKIIRAPLTEQEKWDDDLKVETKYGLWKRPHIAGGDRDRACSTFRDFQHLITQGSEISVARGAYVLDTIIENARAGKSPYPLSCSRILADAGPSPVACDPVAVLRFLSLNDLYRTEMQSETEKEHSYLRRDEILVAGEGIAKGLKVHKPFIVTLTVDDEQHFGKQSADEADVVSVAIEISELD